MEKNQVFEQYNGHKLEWLHDVIRFAVLIAAVFVLFRFVIGIAVVRGDSMTPALEDGTAVLYLRTVRDFRPGDIVSIRVPSGDYYVKRVAAAGGDVVELIDGAVWVNGAAVEDPFAKGMTEKETGAVIYPYAVREGNVFVLGDNREGSMDSRAFGEVNRRQIKGKIILQFGARGIRRVN